MSSLQEQWVVIMKAVEERVRNLRPMTINLLREEIAILRDKIVERFYTNQTPFYNRSTEGTGRRTGTAARGWLSKVNSKKGLITGKLYNSVKYADQRKEKTIRPKSGGNLAVPIGQALTPTGRKKYTGPRDPRIADKLVPIKRHGKPTLLVKPTKGGRRRMDLYYVLVKSVKIPARHQGMDKFVSNRLDRVYKRYLLTVARAMRG